MAGVRLCRGTWDDFPHSDVWYEPASMINHTAAFEAYKRLLAEESRQEAAGAQEEVTLEQMEEEEDLPPP